MLPDINYELTCLRMAEREREAARMRLIRRPKRLARRA